MKKDLFKQLRIGICMSLATAMVITSPLVSVVPAAVGSAVVEKNTDVLKEECPAEDHSAKARLSKEQTFDTEDTDPSEEQSIPTFVYYKNTTDFVTVSACIVSSGSYVELEDEENKVDGSKPLKVSVDGELDEDEAIKLIVMDDEFHEDMDDDHIDDENYKWYDPRSTEGYFDEWESGLRGGYVRVLYVWPEDLDDDDHADLSISLDNRDCWVAVDLVETHEIDFDLSALGDDADDIALYISGYCYDEEPVEYTDGIRFVDGECINICYTGDEEEETGKGFLFDYSTKSPMGDDVKGTKRLYPDYSKWRDIGEDECRATARLYVFDSLSIKGVMAQTHTVTFSNVPANTKVHIKLLGIDGVDDDDLEAKGNSLTLLQGQMFLPRLQNTADDDRTDGYSFTDSSGKIRAYAYFDDDPDLYTYSRSNMIEVGTEDISLSLKKVNYHKFTYKDMCLEKVDSLGMTMDYGPYDEGCGIDYGSGEYHLKNGKTISYEVTSCIVPEGEKIYLRFDTRHQWNVVHARFYDNKVGSSKYIPDKVLTEKSNEAVVIMPDHDLVMDVDYKRVDAYPVVIENNSSADLKTYNYVNEDLYTDLKNEDEVYEYHKIRTAASIADNKKLLVKVKNTETNQIATGGTQGVAISGVIKDFVFRMLGMGVTLSVEEASVEGSGNQVFLAETVGAGSQVDYSFKNGNKVAKGQSVTVDVKSVTKGKQVVVNAYCPDGNLVATGSIEPVFCKVVKEPEKCSFDMPDFPVMVDVYEMAEETSSSQETETSQDQDGTDGEEDKSGKDDKGGKDEPQKPAPTPEEIEAQKIEQVNKKAGEGFGSVDDTVKVEAVKKNKYGIKFDPTAKENIVTIAVKNKLTILDDKAVKGTFESESPAVVKVNKKTGDLTAKKAGTAKVSYKIEEGVRTIVVNVVEPKSESSDKSIEFKKLSGKGVGGAPYCFTVDVPINSKVMVKDKSKVLGTDHKMEFTSDQKLKFSGTAGQKGKVTITIETNGKKTKLNLSFKEPKKNGK